MGPPRVGKTHLAIALGREAILAGFAVQLTTAMAPVAGLVKADAQKRLDDKLLALSPPKRLIVNELGYYLPLEPDAAHLIFQLVSRRYETGATLITSNQSVAEWGDAFAARWRRTHPRPHAASQPRADHPRRQLPAARQAAERPDKGARRRRRPPVGSASLRPVTPGAEAQRRTCPPLGAILHAAEWAVPDDV